MIRLSIISVCFLLLAGCTRKTVVEPKSFIEDPVFLEYCLSAKGVDGNLTIDLNGDGKISIEEAVEVEEIYLENEGGDKDGNNVVAGVRSMAGIEHFTNLRRLNVGNNSLISLDLSRNTRLTYLNCSNNRLSSILLPAGSVLETLNCNGNDLDVLDVSGLSALKYLYCSGRHREESAMDVDSPYGITQLDLSGNPLLRELVCDRNKLTSLDVSGCPALTDLACAWNKIESITLPRDSKLTRLDCSSNRLEAIDVAGQDRLSLLRINDNPLTALDISPCTELRTLECVYCDLIASLDITSNTRLRSLSCNKNPESINPNMNIYVPAGFDPVGMRDWNIGTATVVER